MWNLHYFTAISLGPFGPENISQLHTTLMLVPVRDKDLFLPQNEEEEKDLGLGCGPDVLTAISALSRESQNHRNSFQAVRD
jgi:hypothetical protein